MSTNNAVKRHQASGRFVEYDRSGAVSVRVLDFLRSDTGKDQLKSAREMRDHSSATGTGSSKTTSNSR
jgi:hypothetical protein